MSIQQGPQVYVHVQTNPSQTWTCVHNLGREVVSSDVMLDVSAHQEKALPLEVKHLDNNTLVVSWTTPRTGSVRIR